MPAWVRRAAGTAAVLASVASGCPEVLTTKLVAAGSANRPWMPAEGDLRTRCSAGTNPS